MTTTRIWMIGCFGFAALSAYLAVNLMGTGLNQYGADLHCRFITAQRDVLFKLIPQIRPSLKVDQIVAAANAANEAIVQRTPSSIQLTGGVEFNVHGTEVDGVRSINF